MSKYLDETGLSQLWKKIKQRFLDSTTKYASSPTVAGPADKAISVPFGVVDSTSTATAFTATVDGIPVYDAENSTTLANGTHVFIKNTKVTSAAASTDPKCWTLNVNGYGAKKVYVTTAAATYATTQFTVNYKYLFVYDSSLDSNNGGWYICQLFNSNTDTTGYQIRTASTTRKTTDACRYYKIFFSSVDGTHWVPASADATNSATSAKTVNQRPIDPFGPIVYYSTTTSFSAESNVSASYVWQQYNLTLGYSFNRTGVALTLTTQEPVYIKCAPQADGSAIIDKDNPFVQELPDEEDGKIYIFFGVASGATTVELNLAHPVYYVTGSTEDNNRKIRIWTNPAIASAEVQKYNSDKTDESEGTADYGQTDVVINGDVSTIVTTQAPPSAVRQYIAPSWRAMKEAISDKVDKVTSTDNAVVRFDGTGGAIQNSGVTINDSNHITAVKFVKSGGTASQFLKADGSVDSTSYATAASDNNKVPYEGVLMPTNPFGGKTLYVNSLDNAFSSADKKYYVTVTKHNKSVNGVTYPYIDSTKAVTDDDYYVDSPIVSTYSASAAHLLFDGNYESTLTCSANEYIRIRIMFGQNTSPSATTSYFLGYPYGNYYLSYYYNLIPDTASQCRVYNKSQTHVIGWHLYTATAFNGSLNNVSLIERFIDGGDYYRSCVDFIIFGNSVSGRNVGITQIDYQLSRPNIGRDGSTVTKYDPQSLYHTFKWYNEHEETVSINNNGEVTATKFKKTGGTSSQFLKADGSVDSTTYQAQLVSGTNIKTINNQSLLGSGNITIQGGGTGGDTNVIETVKVNGTALTPDSNKAVNVTVPVYLDDLQGSSSSIHVSQDAFDAKGTYSKPSGGIPKTDLASAVQTSLGLADTALQPSAIIDDTSFSNEHSKAPSGYAVSAALQGKADSATTLAGYGITDAKIESGTITLGSNTITPLTSHQSIKTINNNTITGTGNVTIATPGTLKTDNTTAQNTANNESLSGIVNLHKISKTGNYNDLIDKPTIPAAVTESTVSGWGFTKNAGTITGITMNGASKGTSGVVDLGTVITAHQDISGKVDKVDGKGLSTNDYTTADKTKLAGISEGAEVNVQPNWNETNSSSDAYIQNKPTIPTALADLTEDSSHKVVSQTSIATWNDKAEKVTQVNHGTSDTTYTITPNVLHVWGEVTALTLTLGTGESGVVNEYMFQFYSGNTPTTLTLPNSVIWVQPLTIQAGKTYQVSIVNNLACYITDGMVAAESSGGTPTYATQAWVTSLIDSVPTANSSNVPSSGGTYDMIEGGYYYN